MAKERTLAQVCLKWVLAAVALGLIAFFGFTFQVQERQLALVLRFGAPRSVVTQSGLHFRLPWPFEEVRHYDGRLRYQESGFLETLTRDKKNVVLQTWTTWQISDPLKFATAVGNDEQASKYLDDLTTNATNGVMGNYDLTALVSLDEGDLKIEKIEGDLFDQVADSAQRQYGVRVTAVKLRRVGFPSSNMASVLNQMSADRQKQVVRLAAEGERDASAIRGDADVQAATIRANAQEEAAAITAQSEKDVSAIYAAAHSKDPELFKFLTKLRVLEAAVNESTVLVLRTFQSPFDVLSANPLIGRKPLPQTPAKEKAVSTPNEPAAESNQ